MLRFRPSHPARAAVRSLAFTGLAIVAATFVGPAHSAETTNYEEARAGQLPLPDLLRLENGRRIDTREQWTRLRRPELLQLFENHVYGKPFARPPALRAKEWDNEPRALGGQAVRRQVTLFFTDDDQGPKIELLLFLPPRTAAPAPVFLGLNFQGNQSIQPDPAIKVTASWVRNDPANGATNNRASAYSRGSAASRWPVESIVKRGYGIATAYYGDLFPDHPAGGRDSIPVLLKSSSAEPTSPEQGQAISTWAWGLSRIMDYLVTLPDIDTNRVILMGHSRLGKTALWAGACDERFAIVISNNSGEGGAALSRRNFGETVADLNRAFPHWFCQAYARYSQQPDALPVDHHQLIALIAPRPVYVASATEDRWADPHGEFLAALHAGPVYELFNRPGLGVNEWPAPDRPVGNYIGYHLRTGRHDVTMQDWNWYLDFADRHLRSPPSR
jgi:hypothetical protein